MTNLPQVHHLQQVCTTPNVGAKQPVGVAMLLAANNTTTRNSGRGTTGTTVKTLLESSDAANPSAPTQPVAAEDLQAAAPMTNDCGTTATDAAPTNGSKPTTKLLTFFCGSIGCVGMENGNANPPQHCNNNNNDCSCCNCDNLCSKQVRQRTLRILHLYLLLPLPPATPTPVSGRAGTDRSRARHANDTGNPMPPCQNRPTPRSSSVAGRGSRSNKKKKKNNARAMGTS
mmetsp:Transcript_5881/g.12229  ORF Transcript_5881/g.12229 Transcript_5881/m.12229 type:complete len:229 (-) Transcript_5881:139-825(-)